MQAPDDARYPDIGEGCLKYVAASYRWLKTFFSDNTSMLSLLETYSGGVAYHSGAIDRQLPVEREVANVKGYTGPMACDPKTVVHNDRGHPFGTSKPINGPMDVEAEDTFVNEIVGMLRVECFVRRCSFESKLAGQATFSEVDTRHARCASSESGDIVCTHSLGDCWFREP